MENRKYENKGDYIMKTFHIVRAEYRYFVAVETFNLRGRKSLHDFEAVDLIEAIEYKNNYVKEKGLVW